MRARARAFVPFEYVMYRQIQTLVPTCLFVQSLSTVSVDSIGQRLVSHETGTRYGRQYSVLYIYYYPAVSIMHGSVN